MNTYLKTVLIAVVAVAASALVTARSMPPVQTAETNPTVIVLPASVVTGLLQYLYGRPYQEVAGQVSNMQRCLQDQLPDSNGAVVARGNCPEISGTLQRLAVPVPHRPVPPDAK